MPESFYPIYNGLSRILILGTMPSAESRKQKFYYAHPGNRFWTTLGTIFGVDGLRDFDIAQKTRFLLDSRIALWDVCASCEIDASRDETISNEVANPLDDIFKRAEIRKIFLNGSAAAALFKKHFPDNIIDTAALPSTSPRNAIRAENLQGFVDRWRVIKDSIL